MEDESMAKLLVLDCAEVLSLRWATYSSAPRSREETVTLELCRLRESFVFPPSLYSYIFRGIEEVSDGRSGLVRRTVEWKGINSLTIKTRRSDVFSTTCRMLSRLRGRQVLCGHRT